MHADACELPVVSTMSSPSKPSSLTAMLSEEKDKRLDTFIALVKDFAGELAPESVLPSSKQPVRNAEGEIADEVIGWDINFVYGELTPRGMQEVLRACLDACGVIPPEAPSLEADTALGSDSPGSPGPAPGPSRKQAKQVPPASFWDLGSGEGVPVLVAALCFGHLFRGGCVGAELLAKLDRLAHRHLLTARALLLGRTSHGGEDGLGTEEVRPTLRAEVPPLEGWACEDSPSTLAERCLSLVDLRVADFLQAEGWEGAAVVFCNGTCYQEDVLEPLFKKACKLRPGAVFCITSQLLPPSLCQGSAALFELRWEGVVPSSWGTATARVYRRKEVPRWLSAIKTGGAR